VTQLARDTLVDRRRFDDETAVAVDALLAERAPRVVAEAELRLPLHVFEGEVGTEEGAPAVRERNAARFAQRGQVEPLVVGARRIGVVEGEQRGALHVRRLLEEEHGAFLVAEATPVRPQRARAGAAVLLDEFHRPGAHDGLAFVARIHASHDLFTAGQRLIRLRERNRRDE
jgi:hypothetical protein